MLAGSHLDSQPRGGRFDGAYGVLAAAHAADRLRRHYQDIGHHAPVQPGRRELVQRGGLPVQAVDDGQRRCSPARCRWTRRRATTDTDGVDRGRRAGPDRRARRRRRLRRRTGRSTRYAEIHIEQGRELDKAGLPLGLVDATWAANKYEISVLGAQAHTGATAMADRQDALYGAALAVVAVRELADRFGTELHTSCGQLTVYPNSPVVVAREVHLHLDLRSPSDELLAEADALLRQQFAEIEVKADVRIERRFAHTWTGQAYPPAGVALAAAVAADLGVAAMPVKTRAGHDSTNMKNIVPTVMLFIPSVDGISHAEAEFTRDEDLCTGVDVLTETLARMLEGALARPGRAGDVAEAQAARAA